MSGCFFHSHASSSTDDAEPDRRRGQSSRSSSSTRLPNPSLRPQRSHHVKNRSVLGGSPQSEPPMEKILLPTATMPAIAMSHGSEGSRV